MVTQKSCLAANLLAIAVFVYAGFGFASQTRRELGLELHGGGYENYSLAHVNATGPSDVLHHFWGASRGGISLLIALTKLDTTVDVIWSNESSVDSRIVFSEDPLYSFGIVFPQVIEYKDYKDLANLNAVPGKDVTFYDMRHIQWRGTVKNDKSDSVVLRFSAVKLFDFVRENSSKPIPFRDESFVFQVSIADSKGRGAELPHLGHSMNCSEIQLRLNGLELPTMSNYSRFSLPVTVVSSDDLINGKDGTASGISLEQYSSMDDEYSPGIFQMVKLGTSSVQDAKPGGFMVWRPVAYLTEARDFNDATNVVAYDLKDVGTSRLEGLNETLLYAYFGKTWNRYHVQSTNLSFGLPEDGWFFGTNFTVWNLVVGYGSPPKDEFSGLILTAIIVCVLVPAGFTIFGAVFVIAKRVVRRGPDLQDPVATSINS